MTPLPPVDHVRVDVSIEMIAYPHIDDRGGVESVPDSFFNQSPLHIEIARCLNDGSIGYVRYES